jgi:hypothetical protein
MNNSFNEQISSSPISEKNFKNHTNTKIKSRFSLAPFCSSNNFLPPKKSTSQKFNKPGGMLGFSQENIIFYENEYLEKIENLSTFLCKNFVKAVQVAEFANTPNGSRILQRKLNGSSQEEIQFLLEKIMQFLPNIMTNSFGNYFCKELFQFCSSLQRNEIFKSVSITHFIFLFSFSTMAFLKEFQQIPTAPILCNLL